MFPGLQEFIRVGDPIVLIFLKRLPQIFIAESHFFHFSLQLLHSVFLYRLLQLVEIVLGDHQVVFVLKNSLLQGLNFLFVSPLFVKQYSILYL